MRTHAVALTRGHVATRAGKRLGGRSDTRVRAPELAAFYGTRVLDRWAELDAAYTAMWARRGVKVAEA